jgi:hypothetical protein
MTLPTSPPYYGPVGSWEALKAASKSIKLGEKGWRAYAVQCMVGVNPDGDWGPATDTAVKTWQREHMGANEADGLVGPATQATMLAVKSRQVDTHYHLMPDGLIAGFCRVEGGNLLAPTNWYTPPGGKVGVDCGPGQLRVYQITPGVFPLHSADDKGVVGMYDALNPIAALYTTARSFTARISAFRQQAPRMALHRLIEAAVLAHNWPVGAGQIIRNGGEVSSPDMLAEWTTIPADERARYGGRTHYTRGEWSYEYPRRVLKEVTY